jgi:hypothetical protein
MKRITPKAKSPMTGRDVIGAIPEYISQAAEKADRLPTMADRILNQVFKLDQAGSLFNLSPAT